MDITYLTDKANMKRIGERIRAERAKLGLTQDKLSEMIDCTQNFLGEIERGQRLVSLRTLVKICIVLHVSLDDIIFGADDKDTPKSDNRHEIYALLDKCSQEDLDTFASIIKAVLPRLR